jgi:hypothetical protein
LSSSTDDASSTFEEEAYTFRLDPNRRPICKFLIPPLFVDLRYTHPRSLLMRWKRLSMDAPQLLLVCAFVERLDRLDSFVLIQERRRPIRSISICSLAKQCRRRPT